MNFVFATRPSALARWQTNWVCQALIARHPDLSCTQQVITTHGDRVLDRPLPEIGGKGVFTQELEAELHSGQVHAAVHSLKDLPVSDAPGLTVGAIPARAEVRDALVSRGGEHLADLPAGAIVGTSSLRRSAQLLAARPDLEIQPLRGNVETRLRKLEAGQYDAIILAGAGLQRLGLDAQVSEWLSLELMLPAPGQGALAVQCRADDIPILARLAALEDPDTRRAVTAERAFLQALGGGCAVPVAAYASVNPEGIHLTGRVAALDGRRVIECQVQGSNPLLVGYQCAQAANQQGAHKILSAVQAAGEAEYGSS